MSNKVYAKITLQGTDTIEIRASYNKDELYGTLPTAYLMRGVIFDDWINEALEEINPSEIYIDMFTMSRLGHGLYRKYSKYIIEDFYKPDIKKNGTSNKLLESVLNSD